MVGAEIGFKLRLPLGMSLRALGATTQFNPMSGIDTEHYIRTGEIRKLTQ